MPVRSADPGLEVVRPEVVLSEAVLPEAVLPEEVRPKTLLEEPTTINRVTERVCVFIDGQNLFKGLNRRFKGRIHPLLLARELAGDRKLVGTHYYSGIHDAGENKKMFDLVTRRHDLIRKTGVTVTERTLRYHWEWRVDDRLPPPWHDDAGERHTAKVKRWRGAREKGIDVALALDAVASALTDECDVVIIVSRDRDLMEIASEIHARCGAQGPDCVRVEVAFVSERRGDEGHLPDYDAQQEIDENTIEIARDHFDYRNDLDNKEVQAFLDSLAG